MRELTDERSSSQADAGCINQEVENNAERQHFGQASSPDRNRRRQRLAGFRRRGGNRSERAGGGRDTLRQPRLERHGVGAGYRLRADRSQPVGGGARCLVVDSAAAEDLTQETFARAYRARQRYTPTAPPGAWLRRIGINLAISYLRRQKLARFLPARLYIAPDRRDYDRAEARDVVEKALATLSYKLRAAVVLHYYEGLTREEIAAVLGVPAGTVASRIAKAVATMRKTMGSDQQDETARSSSEGA